MKLALVIIILLLVVVIILLGVNLWVSLGGMNPMRMMPMMGGGMSSIFGSNGERIFKTGTDERGEAIPNSMMSGMGGCQMCHGADGHGGQMMGRTEPCNTFKCLGAEGYTEDLVKRAITQGMGPDGRRLDLVMPRWQMSEADLNEVIAYLKTLP